jgi:CRISPR-associated endonuclease/helicase Cas3
MWPTMLNFVRRMAILTQRIKRLPDQPCLRPGKLAAVEAAFSRQCRCCFSGGADAAPANVRAASVHHSTHKSGKTVSFGLVRMANINPLVAVAQALMALPSPENYRIHYCVYTASTRWRFAAAIEKRLDAAFTRHEPSIWQLRS